MPLPLNTMKNIKHEAARTNNPWFRQSAMRFFNCRLSENVYPTGDADLGTFFVSSERCDHVAPRLYTVRRAWIEKNKNNAEYYLRVETWSEFQEYATRSAAHKAAKRAMDEFLGLL